MRNRLMVMASVVALAILAVSPAMAQSGGGTGSFSIDGGNEASIGDADGNTAISGGGGDAAGGSGGAATGAQYSGEGDSASSEQYGGDGGDAQGGSGGDASVSGKDTNVIDQENNAVSVSGSQYDLGDGSLGVGNSASIEDGDENSAISGGGGDAQGGSGGDATGVQYSAGGESAGGAQYGGAGGDAQGGADSGASTSDNDTNVINQESNTTFNFSPEGSGGNFLINLFMV